MYVRWKRQKRSKKVKYQAFATGNIPWGGPGSNQRPWCEKEAYLLTAYLVENTRFDGKPRHKILSYLGSINEEKRTTLGAIEKFWQSVDTHLKALRLKRDQRAAIEEKLQQRVPKVSENVLFRINRIGSYPPWERGRKWSEELAAFRERHHLPGDDIVEL